MPKIDFLTRAATTLATMAVAIGSPIAQAQTDWPNKPVRIVAPYPPGGSTDQVARILAQQLTAQLGHNFIVENRVGANGAVGSGTVAKATPDGYNLLVVFDLHAVNPSLIPQMPFDTLKELAPVMVIGTSPMVIAAHPGQPFKSFTDVAAAAKVNKGGVSYGSIGTGSLGHLAMLQLATDLNIPLTHIPYKGGGPLVQDAIAGHVPLMIATVFVANPQIQNKRLVPLAVTGSKRAAALPNVATLAEQGAPNFEALAWWGFFAPAGTPESVLKKLHDELTKALKVPSVAERLQAQGMEVLASSPAQLDSFLRREIERWGKVVRDNQIKLGE